MIILRLAGGLGNQLFQLGASLFFLEEIKCTLLIDDSFLGKYTTERENCLHLILKLNENIVFKSHWINRLRLPKLLPIYPFVSDNNFQESLKIFTKRPQRIIMDGYFQECLTQENFDNISNILKRYLIKKPVINKKKNECVIHIRGGDFIELGWNSVTSEEYYLGAMGFMVAHCDVDKFYIVTDDKGYSQGLLKNSIYNFSFIGESLLEDFHLIGSYSKRILSASTFALWASELGCNKQSIVISPRFWSSARYKNILLTNEVII